MHLHPYARRPPPVSSARGFPCRNAMAIRLRIARISAQGICLAASTMSFARTRQSLGSTYGLCKNAFSEFFANHSRSCEIDTTPEKLLELALHTGFVFAALNRP